MSRLRNTKLWGLRRPALFLTDSVALFVGLVLAATARYDGQTELIDRLGLLVGLAVMVGAYGVLSLTLRLHQGRHAIGSADELTALAVALAGSTLALSAVVAVSGVPRLLPLSVPPVGGVMAFVLMLAVRLIVRRQREGSIRPQTGRRVLVFGAGAAGTQLIRAMLHDPDSPYLPVGVLDDDPRLKHARISGVRMLGDRHALADAVDASDASMLVIALPSAGAELIREISRVAKDAGLDVKVLPRISDLVSPRVGIRDVRDIDIADLLGRRQIETDVGAIAGYLRGKRVLVTGAGGSIGSELCVQLAGFKPAELIMLDRDESALHAVHLRLHGEARLDERDVVLADIRDSNSIERVFHDRRPEVVFHAAALKHVNMLEQYPEEGWKTNVLGTRNVLEAAKAAGVDRFINISTDKAADPVNVLGHTKRTAEQLTAAYAEQVEGSYVSVRFGNVLGSRGSVLTTFAAQIARGGPLTVTDPEVTRFFMTIPEAVELVIQAGAIGGRGEALVLDMGAPVRIRDVALQLIALSGKDVSITYTGLRPGEKLHEELFGRDEHDHRPVHRLISHVHVPAYSSWDLQRLGRRSRDHEGAPSPAAPSGSTA